MAPSRQHEEGLRPMDMIAMAIPVFFLLIGLELWAARREGKQLYRLNDSLNDLSCGMLDQVVGAFWQLAVFGVYILIWERFRLLEISTSSVLAWVLCFLGVDFFYYWF